MKKSCFGLVLALLAPLGAARAQETFCGAGFQPLLEVVEVVEITPASTGKSTLRHESTFLSRDGQAVRSQTTTPAGEPFRLDALVARARLAPAVLAELKAVLAGSQAGLLESCFLPVPTGGGQISQRRASRVTWHGRGARTNTFTLSNLDPSLPECGPQFEVLEAFGAATSDALFQPAAEVLSSPP